MQSVKAVAFSCLHAPFVDDAAFASMLDIVRREKPDYVVGLGDFMESSASSRWPDAKELGKPLKLEFQDLNTKLEQIRGAAGNAELIALEGNHEANLAEPGRIDPLVRSVCDWRLPQNVPEWEHWKFAASYKYCRRRGAFRIGQQVVFAHGYETSPGPVRREAFYFADEWGLYIHGHTHRPTAVEEVTWCDLGLRKWYANVGCLRELDPHYMTRKRKWNWGHAVGIIECQPVKSPRCCREWEARIEIIGMYDARMAA